MRVIKIFLLFVCCISLDVQSQTFLSDTLGINEDGSVIIAKSLALPGWILGVDVDSTDNLLFTRYRNLSKNETSLKNKGGISVYSLADQRMLWQRPVNYFNQDPKLTSEGVLFVTMGKATSLLDLKTGNEVWKKKKMIPYCVDAKNRMFYRFFLFQYGWKIRSTGSNRTEKTRWPSDQNGMRYPRADPSFAHCRHRG